MKNYYQILQVDKNASPSVITKVYRYLIKESHPDLYSDEDDKEIAEIRIKELNEAYEVLSNPDLRKKYNDELETKNQDMQQYIKKLEQELAILKKEESYNKYINEDYSSDESLNQNPTQNINDVNYTYAYIKYLFQKILGIILLGIGFILLILTIF